MPMDDDICTVWGPPGRAWREHATTHIPYCNSQLPQGPLRGLPWRI